MLQRIHAAAKDQEMRTQNAIDFDPGGLAGFGLEADALEVDHEICGTQRKAAPVLAPNYDPQGIGSGADVDRQLANLEAGEFLHAARERFSHRKRECAHFCKVGLRGNRRHPITSTSASTNPRSVNRRFPTMFLNF
ncbi:hypothetical protein ACCC88_03200 [Sphingomonas sp. Sphisp140]|uniref:hypothetical protein n=1 Tax=unclassified Sphingomonas TaxID=196159 RepID=UPI0039B093C8